MSTSQPSRQPYGWYGHVVSEASFPQPPPAFIWRRGQTNTTVWRFLRIREGYLELPTAPGLGVEIEDNAIADKLGHDWRNLESYDADDGSVVDW